MPCCLPNDHRVPPWLQMAEYLVLSPGADKIVPLFGDLFTDEPLPADGYIDLPDRPGFGVTLNREGVDLRRPYVRERPTLAEIEARKDADTVDQADWLGRAAKIPVKGPLGTE